MVRTGDDYLYVVVVWPLVAALAWFALARRREPLLALASAAVLVGVGTMLIAALTTAGVPGWQRWDCFFPLDPPPVPHHGLFGLHDSLGLLGLGVVAAMSVGPGYLLARIVMPAGPRTLLIGTALGVILVALVIWLVSEFGTKLVGDYCPGG